MAGIRPVARTNSRLVTSRPGGISSSSYWTPSNAVVENAAPTQIVLTYAKKVKAAEIITANFTITGNTCTGASLDATEKIATLTFANEFIYGDSIVLFANGTEIAVTNNVLGLPALGLIANIPLYGASNTQQFPDLSGNNIVLYNGTNETVEPVEDAVVTPSGVMGLETLTSRLKAPDNELLRFTNGFTISIVYDDRQISASANRYILHKNSNDYAIIVGYVARTMEMYGDVDLRTGSQIVMTGDYDQHIYTYSYNGSKLVGFRDDNKIVNVDNSVTINTTADALFLMHDGAGDGVNGIFTYMVMYNRGLTDAEILQLHKHLRGKINRNCKDAAAPTPDTFTHGVKLLPHLLTDDIIAFDGDSLTYGGGGTSFCNIADSIPVKIMANYTGYDWYNLGIPGKKVSDAITAGAARTDSLFRVGKKNICTVWYGTNDMALAPTVDGETAYNNLVTYCQARQTAGWDVVVLNCINREDVDIETQRAIFNGLIASNWATFADAYVDLAGDARIGANNAANNLTYFFNDKVHLNDVGNEIVIGLLKAAIDTLL